MVLAAGSMGCKSTQTRISEALQREFEFDQNLQSQLCGYRVLGISGVRVTGVTNSGSSSTGTGTATVTATPTLLPGSSFAASSCSAVFAFRYATYSSSYRGYRGRRTSNSNLVVDTVYLSSRVTPVPAGAMPMYGTPSMPVQPGGYPMPTMPTQPTFPGGIPGMPTFPTNMGSMGASGRTALAPGVAMPTQVGMVQTGTLQPGDIPMSNGAVADDYAMNLVAGTPVTVVLRGGPRQDGMGTLDMYAILLLNGTEVAHNDDGPNGLNSQLIYTPATSGTYTMRVTTFSSGTGGYGMYTMQSWPGDNPSAQ